MPALDTLHQNIVFYIFDNNLRVRKITQVLNNLLKVQIKQSQDIIVTSCPVKSLVQIKQQIKQQIDKKKQIIIILI